MRIAVGSDHAGWKLTNELSSDKVFDIAFSAVVNKGEVIPVNGIR